MAFVPTKASRAYVPSLPLYAWRELTFAGDPAIVVPRGHRVPAEAIATLSDEALRQLFWVRHVDHAPVPNITPADQMPDAERAAPHRPHKRAG